MLRVWSIRSRAAAPGRPTRARRAALAVAVAGLLGALLPAATPGGASPQDEIDAKQAEADRLEAEIEANGAHISMLAEDYNAARFAIEEATAGIADAEARAGEAESEMLRIRALLADRAVELYVNAGSTGPLPELDSDSVREIGTRSQYAAAAADRDDTLLTDLTGAREQLADRTAELEAARSQAEHERDALEQARTEVEAAQAAQEQLLAQVQGDLARLVAEEQERTRQEEEQRARVEFARRQAAEQAARAERTQRDPESEDTPDAPRTPDSPPPPDSSPPPDVPAPNPNAQIAVDTAKAQIGKPYRYAASGPDEFDCSGLTMFAWAAAGVSLPHSSRAQYASLPHVPMDALAPGDLLFYGSPIHHVGIYAGDGMYIHAPQTGDFVKVSSIYRRDFAGAARPG